ncbi:MAG TPA: transglycosylase domain-containing protein [Solirubrobacteraceae bacterium]|nr:transglycosylase domain-containing protein [Solirubrobacteraceae bacterium]
MSRLTRQRRRRGPSRILFVALVAFASTLFLGAVGAVAYVLSVADSTKSLAERHPIVEGASSEVYAADGTRLGFIQSDELRSPVPWSQIPADLANATVAIEDQRFYKDDGIDPTGIFRAAVKDLAHGRVLQGGSTITMQLVRNLYLGGDQRTFKQKIEEAKLALEYNERHTKREILTNYLNSVPYGTVGGQTAIGVQAASRIFFDKPAAQLDLEQCALLAGLPQAPSEYNPFLNPAAARQRRNEVLGKMAQLHYITYAQAAAAERAPLELQHGDFYSEKKESFFFEYVRQQLIRRYGRAVVERGGLQVHTTLDLHMQELAHKAIAEVLDLPEDPASAIVTIDPHNGYIETMAESESYEQSQFNLASEGHRQPGSTFKAIDLADALAKGVDPDTTYYLSHTLYKGWLAAEPNYEVHTFEGTSLNKSINLVQATLTSDNTVYAQLAADLGEESITETAYKMGVKTHLEGNPSQAIGGLTYGVTPLEMAVVYATLADGGYRNEPIAITKVVFPDGRVDSSWGVPHRVKVLSNGVTAEETKILHENVLSGTAVRSAIECPTAAKTGTTTELVDAWLDGYTPEYSTVVWMGYPKERVPMTDVHGEPQQGGALPAVIWHDYMNPVVGSNCVAFPQPTEPLVYKPFFGKYQSSGESGASSGRGLEPLPAVGAVPTLPTGKAHHHREAPAPNAGNETPGAGAEPRGGGGAAEEETSKPKAAEPAAPNNAPTPAEPGATGNAGVGNAGGHGGGGGTGGAPSGGTAPP